MKNWMVIAAVLLGTSACQEQSSKSSSEGLSASGMQIHKIQGEAQGSTYHISYFSDAEQVVKSEVDSILDAIDASLSTYDSASLITALNRSDSTHTEFDDYNNFFSDNIRMSREVFRITQGAFDPTVAPLVNGWGFGFKSSEEMNQLKVDSMMQFVGFDFDRVRLSKTDDRDPNHPGRMYYKLDPRTVIDFNAIAQGYSVDVLADYFESKGIMRYMIEVGGELRVGDSKPEGVAWSIGIDKPKSMDEERELQAIIDLSNTALATSGNYRKFYVKEDGQRVAHTIDPRTGYPVDHGLLSVTVIHPNCAMADAFATAFMVMGTEATKQFIASADLPIEVYLIYDEGGENKTWATAGMEAVIRN